MLGIIRISRHIATIERRAVVGRQREAALQAAGQVGVGDEDAAEGDRVGMAVPDRRIRRLAVKPPAVIKTPFQIGRNSTIAEGTF